MPPQNCPVSGKRTDKEILQNFPTDKSHPIAIAGASGFVGKNLCKRLVEEGKKIRVLVRSDKDDDFFKSLGATIYQGEITDPTVCDWFLDGAEVLYNLSAVVSKRGVDEQEFYDVHVKAVELLCQSAVKNQLKKYLHCSTIGVLGTITDPPADENSPYNAVDIYQRSKAEGEKTALSYHGKGGLAVTVVRPAVVYGPYDKRMRKLFKMIDEKKFRMIGSGKTLTHPVYVDDLVTGMILACESKKADGEIYILGGEKAVTIAEWVEIIAEEAGVTLSSFHIPYRPLWFVSFLCEIVCGVLGVEPPLFRRRVDFFVKDRAFTIKKAKRDLGYEPKIDLHEGARRTLADLDRGTCE